MPSPSLFTFMHWGWKWQPTPVFLPGESQGRGSLVGCHLWGCTESDTTKQLPFHFSLSCTGDGNGNPLQCSCLENPRDRGAWWASVYGVAQSWTRLKRFSSSSSSSQTGSFMRFRIIFRVHVLGLSSASSARLGVWPLARYVTCWNSITPPPSPLPTGNH